MCLFRFVSGATPRGLHRTVLQRAENDADRVKKSSKGIENGAWTSVLLVVLGKKKVRVSGR